MRAILKSAAALALAACLMFPMFRSAPSETVSALSVHAPFRIDSDADFTSANGVTGGSGTAADPWRIGGWDISGALHACCIYVGNTTQPFVIENCRAHNASGNFVPYYYTESGIIFYNVTGGRVSGSVAENNGFDGICLYNSTLCSVSGNTVRLNDYGITLMDGSGNNSLDCNSVSDNGYYGMGLFQSPRNNVTGNRVWGHAGPGISVSGSEGNRIESNNVSGNENGLDLWESSGNRLAYNLLLSNTNGIYLEYSEGNVLSRNNASGNMEFGIRMASSTGNRVCQNRLGGNGMAQARDGSGGNAWDGGYPAGGNWWGDYSGADSDRDGFGDTPYLGIHGNMGARDRYPLMVPWFDDREPPAAHAGQDMTVPEDAHAVFNATASTDNVGIVNYTWNFTGADGDVIFWGSVAEAAFPDPGVFTVTLRVTDSSGNGGADALSVAVLDTTPPVADAGPDMSVPAGTAACLNAAASHDNLAITNFTWSLEDGGARELYGAVAFYTFFSPGEFGVTLEARDAAGLAGFDSMMVSVYADTESPVAEAGPDLQANVSEAVMFDGSSSTDDWGITNYTWALVHNGTSCELYGATAAFTFWAGGNYTVTLTAADAAGNAGSDCLTVHVVLAPPAPDNSTEYSEGPGGQAGGHPFAAVAAALAASGIVLLLWCRRRSGKPLGNHDDRDEDCED